MEAELENKLCERFPLLFRGRYLNLKQNLMMFGCECNSGWYNIIYMVCLGLESEVNKLYSYPYRKAYKYLMAFERFINPLLFKLPKFLQKKTKFGYIPYFLVRFQRIPMFVQIKEKYGTLRMYLDRETDVMSNYIQLGETASEHTCETCGKWGKLHTNGWWYTACKEHTKEQDLEEKVVSEDE